MDNSENENIKKQNKKNTNKEEVKEFGSNLIKDLSENEELRVAFISFLKALLLLIQKKSMDVNFDIETCVMQALSSYDILMDYPLFDKYLKKYLKKPNLSNQIKFFATFLSAIGVLNLFVCFESLELLFFFLQD